MEHAIASQKIWAQRPGSEPFEVHLQIGAPYLVSESQQEWACAVSLSPLFKVLSPSHGGSSFQALCLASSLALGLLHSFREKEGALYYSTGDEFEFGPFSFGVPGDYSEA
jgi:hypothetical protein